jgi:hypothetical protein
LVLARVVQVEAWLFLAALALVLVHRLVSGEIDIGQAQLSRMQLLFAAIGFAAYYLSLVVSNPHAAALPDPGVAPVATLGGSSLLYLSNKLVGLWSAITGSDRIA